MSVSVLPFNNHRHFFEQIVEQHRLNDSLIVCPNPSIADSVRERSPAETQVITISKFVSTCLENFQFDGRLLRKSDLMFSLAGLWKIKFPSANKTSFDMAFKFFTELRSVTTSFIVAENVLKEFEPIIEEAIEIFWHYLDQVEDLDEPSAYQFLVDHFMADSSGLKNKLNVDRICFWGFSHLTGYQTDFIHCLGKEFNISIPFPKKVLSQCKHGDWINNFGFELDGEDESVANFDLNIARYPSGRLSTALKNTEQQWGSSDIYLGEKNPSENKFFESPNHNHGFRCRVDIFDSILESIYSLFKNKSIHVDTFEGEVNHLLMRAKNKQQWRVVKVLLLLKKTVLAWSNLSEKNESLGPFDWAIIKEVLVLDLPRTFISTSHGNQDFFSIHGIEMLDQAKAENPAVLCLGSQYSPLRNNDQTWSEDLKEFCSALGPVRRSELDFLLAKESIVEFLKESNKLLLLESGIEEHQQEINELLKCFTNINVINIKSDQSYPVIQSEGERVIDSRKEIHSSSSLQLYLDCPAKYFHNYHEKIGSQISLTSEVSASELGTLEHKVIQVYMENNRSWDIDHLKVIILKEFKKLKKDVSTLAEDRSLLEVISYTEHVIRALLEIYQWDENAQFYFEKEILDQGFRGQIDCLINTHMGWMLLDFKRSSASIATIKSLEELTKIQMPFYLNHSQVPANEIISWGYINLSEIEESLVFTNSPSFKFENIKMREFNVPLEEYLLEYQRFEQKLIDKIKMDSLFIPDPIDENACTFCSMNTFCNKGEGRV